MADRYHAVLIVSVMTDADDGTTSLNDKVSLSFSADTPELLAERLLNAVPNATGVL